MMAPPVHAGKLVSHACTAVTQTGASSTGNFKGEAITIFQQVQDEAHQALDLADKLKNSFLDPEMEWSDASEHLEELRDTVNDMGTRVCRLQTIRNLVAPWQQAEIDRIDKSDVLMANNTQDAILFANRHMHELWENPYRLYTSNLYSQANKLTQSIDSALSYARISREYQDLNQKVQTHTVQ